MSDETQHVALAPAAQSTIPPQEKTAQGSILGAAPPAATRLRSFEDVNFGKDCTRINGTVERGVGSRFKAMSPEKSAEYAALEALVKAEQAVADASAATEKAKADHDAALARLAAAQKTAVH